MAPDGDGLCPACRQFYSWHRNGQCPKPMTTTGVLCQSCHQFYEQHTNGKCPPPMTTAVIDPWPTRANRKARRTLAAKARRAK